MNKNYNFQKGIKIIVKEKGKFHQIDIDKITHITSDNNIYSFHIQGKKEIVSIYKVLKEIEQELLNYDFFCINKNTIVNLSRVKTYFKKENKPIIKLSNNKEVIISRRKLSDFFAKFNN